VQLPHQTHPPPIDCHLSGAARQKRVLDRFPIFAGYTKIGENMLPKVDLEFSPTRQRALGIPVLPQQTFIENVFTAQAKASYTFDFFGAAFLADRALAGQVRQQAFQLESTRRALATAPSRISAPESAIASRSPARARGAKSSAACIATASPPSAC